MRSALCATLFAIVSLGILLAGCSAHTQLSVNSGTPPPRASTPAPGTSVTSSSAGLQVQASSGGFAAAIIAVSLLAGAVQWSSEERPFPNPSSLVSPTPAPAPALSPERRVREQDCTKPVVDPYSNLRCK
jgi:outer membrane murein-binding lipoprotein Lpp